MSRLPSGTRKRPDGTLEKRFSVNGQRYSIYGKNSKELALREREVREEIEQGLYNKNRNITLNEYFEEYIKRQEGVIKKSTLIQIQTVYKIHFRDVIGKKKIREIEKRELIKLQRDMAASGMKETTVNLDMTRLKAIFNMAVFDEIIAKNPAGSEKPLFMGFFR